MKEFGHNQINDPHLNVLVFYQDANEVFGRRAGISDGISIVSKNLCGSFDKFKYISINHGKTASFIVPHPGEELMPLNPVHLNVIHKIESMVKQYKLTYLHDVILPRSLFGIESNFVEEHPEKVRAYVNGERFDPSHEVKIFTNDKAGKRGRAKWFIADKDEIKQGIPYIKEWQVVVSSANAGGQKRDNQLAIIDNQSAFGRARVALRSFKTINEAQNFKKYIQSTFIRYAFLLTNENLSSLAKYVPDFIDYSDKNRYIDFHKDIDSQLYQMLNLNQDEIAFVKEVVDEVWGKR